MSAPVPGTEEWLSQVVEDVVDPQRRIVDPHHHLWPAGGALPYGPDELLADVSDGHNIVATVYMECGAAYDTTAPAHLAPLGETRFITDVSRARSPRLIAGMVGRADLRRDDLDDILDRHVAIAGDLFKGIRDALSHAIHPDALSIPGRAPRDLYLDPDFRRGVARLGERGFTYDSWHYHYQNVEFLELARATPGTTLVLDHFGTPLGVGPWAGRRAEIFAEWKNDIARIAECPNVVAKLGGLAMPDNGFGWNLADRPPGSDEFVEAQKPWYLHVIECFGPGRCMFESNFPVDRRSLSYRTLWNALKKMVADFGEDDKHALFEGTARRIYSLD